MPIISIIVAVDKNFAIGRDNQLLCHLPNDLKYFKKVTQGHTVIMGRKTYQSLPNGALPNRRNIVLSRNTNLDLDTCETATDLDHAIEVCKDENEIFIIGGASVYNESIRIADKLYITYIDHSFGEADSFFPDFNSDLWKQVSRTDNKPDERNVYPYSFAVYERIV